MYCWPENFTLDEKMDTLMQTGLFAGIRVLIATAQHCQLTGRPRLSSPDRTTQHWAFAQVHAASHPTLIQMAEVPFDSCQQHRR